MKRKQDRLIVRLTKYFISSTLIPFLLIITISASLMDYYYRQDVLTITDGYLKSLSSEVSLYIKDLQQIVLLPYFSNEIINLIQNLSGEKEITFFDRTKLESALDSLLSSIRYTRNDFYSALIVKDQNVLYSSSNYIDSIPLPGHDWTQETWYQQAINSDGKEIFLPPHVPDYYDSTDIAERISLVGTIRNLRTRNPYAVIKIDALTTSFDQFFSEVNFHVPSCIYITDSENHLIYVSSTEKKMEELLHIEQNGDYRQVLSTEPKRSFHLFKEIPETDYTLHVILDRYTIWLKSARIYFFGILFYIIAFMTALFLNRRFSRRVTAPVAQIRNVLASVEKGDFSVRYHHRPQWELQELGQRINQMIEELEKTIQKTYVAQLAQKEAENKALLSQIQPHFLFNTINSLIALIYDQDITKLESGLYSLSDMLHYVLRKEDTVTLDDEIGFISDYLLLQQIRFSDRLHYHIELPESAKGVVVPRLILQPFVENAIIHGIEPETKMSNIDIRVRSGSEAITIEIKDDGVGFDCDTTDIMSSVGITNCIHRLHLQYPKSMIDISSAVGKGCTVILTIPITAPEGR